MYWIMIQQIAGKEQHMPWAVGYLDARHWLIDQYFLVLHRG
jgi:hypothetical protein